MVVCVPRLPWLCGTREPDVTILMVSAWCHECHSLLCGAAFSASMNGPPLLHPDQCPLSQPSHHGARRAPCSEWEAPRLSRTVSTGHPALCGSLAALKPLCLCDESIPGHLLPGQSPLLTASQPDPEPPWVPVPLKATMLCRRPRPDEGHSFPTSWSLHRASLSLLLRFGDFSAANSNC